MPRPGRRSPLTDAVHKAHANILRAYKLADDKHATIPLMHETVDPRTVRKHKELYDGLVNQMRAGDNVQENSPANDKRSPVSTNKPNPFQGIKAGSQDVRPGKDGLSELTGDGPVVYQQPKKINKKKAKGPIRRSMAEKGGHPVDATKNWPLEQASSYPAMSDAGPGAAVDVM